MNSDNNLFQKSNLRNVVKGTIKKSPSVKFFETEFKKNPSINSCTNLSVNSSISKNNSNNNFFPNK